MYREEILHIMRLPDRSLSVTGRVACSNGLTRKKQDMKKLRLMFAGTIRKNGIVINAHEGERYTKRVQNQATTTKTRHNKQQQKRTKSTKLKGRRTNPFQGLAQATVCLVGDKSTRTVPALCRDARVYGHAHTTTAMHDMSTTPLTPLASLPPRPLKRLQIPGARKHPRNTQKRKNSACGKESNQHSGVGFGLRFCPYLSRDVVHHDNPIRAPVVRRRDCPEALLSRSIPLSVRFCVECGLRRVASARTGTNYYGGP